MQLCCKFTSVYVCQKYENIGWFDKVIVLLPWVKEMKHRGVTIVSSRSFKISTEQSIHCVQKKTPTYFFLHNS